MWQDYQEKEREWRSRVCVTWEEKRSRLGLHPQVQEAKVPRSGAIEVI